MAAKCSTVFFYLGNQLANLLAPGRGISYLRSNASAISEYREDLAALLLLACEEGGTVAASVAALEAAPGVAAASYTPYGHRFFDSLPAASLGFNGELLMGGLEAYLLGNGNRVYSPSLMRFISPDSYGAFVVGNVYGYCDGDPVNRLDPTGHTPLSRYIHRHQMQTIISKGGNLPGPTLQAARAIAKIPEYVQGNLNVLSGAIKETSSIKAGLGGVLKSKGLTLDLLKGHADQYTEALQSVRASARPKLTFIAELNSIEMSGGGLSPQGTAGANLLDEYMREETMAIGRLQDLRAKISSQEGMARAVQSKPPDVATRAASMRSSGNFYTRLRKKNKKSEKK